MNDQGPRARLALLLASLAVSSSLASSGCTIGGLVIGGVSASVHNQAIDDEPPGPTPQPHVSVQHRALVGGAIGLLIDIVAVTLIVLAIQSTCNSNENGCL